MTSSLLHRVTLTMSMSNPLKLTLKLHYLKWFHHLKHDPVNKEVKKTLCRFMDDEAMDYDEASGATVDKRKFLLNRIFKAMQVPN